MISAPTANVAIPLAALFLVAGSGCRPPESATSASPVAPKTATLDSHQRMLEKLDLLRKKSAYDDEYFGTAKVDLLARQLETLTETDSPNLELALRVEYAGALLILGETEQAISQLQKCADIYDRAKGSLPGEAGVLLRFLTGLAYLRLAENQNCVHCRNGESCIIPIRDSGVHQFPLGAKKSIEHLGFVLNDNPNNFAALWLLNIAYMTIGGYPHEVPKEWLIAPDVFESDEPFPRFKNISDQLGLDVVSLCGGTIVDDFNNDGWLDVVTSSWNTSSQIQLFVANGDGKFVDKTTDAGLKGILGGLNLVQADYDNDGDVDILVLRGAWLGAKGRQPNSLLANDGSGRFRDVTLDVGMGGYHFPTQTACWADYDNDGDLDLFVGNEHGPSQLFNNNGDGHFTDVAQEAGVTNGNAAKGCGWGDFNNDRYPDLYVSNLAGPNRLYHNNADGTFTDVAKTLGVAEPNVSFPMWFWDFNNDGFLDIFVSAYDFALEHFVQDYLGHPHDVATDRLFQGDGKGGFRDVSKAMNLDHVTLAMGANFGDLDNDGYPDFYLGTGFTNYEALIPNRMFHNQKGQRFADVTTAGGFGHLQKGHGVAFADFDHDGDQDVFIELGGAYLGDAFANAVFENPGFGNHWLVVKLVGTRSNRFGVGARIHALVEEDGNTRSIFKCVNTGGSFGANPLRQHIGLGSATKVQCLEVYWPTTDTTQQFDNVASDQMIEITEGNKQFRVLALPNRSNHVQ